MVFWHCFLFATVLAANFGWIDCNSYQLISWTWCSFRSAALHMIRFRICWFVPMPSFSQRPTKNWKIETRMLPWSVTCHSVLAKIKSTYPCFHINFFVILPGIIESFTLLASISASSTDLKRIQIPHNLFRGFWADKICTTCWSGCRKQVWEFEFKLKPLKIIWQSQWHHSRRLFQRTKKV